MLLPALPARVLALHGAGETTRSLFARCALPRAALLCRPRYSLATFHTLADSFKSNWFGHKARDGTGSVPVKDIERDFWQLVEEGSLRHDVNVLCAEPKPPLMTSRTPVLPYSPYFSILVF